MRTADVTINGKRHVLCCNLRFVRSASERYGSMRGMYDALETADDVKALDEAVWVVAQMMAAGSRYAAEMGMENEAPLTAEELLDLCDLSDFRALRNAIIRTMTAGKSRNVEIETLTGDDDGEEKNGETTRES